MNYSENVNATHEASLSLLDRAAIAITKVVGSMWCAIAFALLASVSLPEAIKGGIATLIAWIAQTFLQLVLLSVIMVGQDLQNRHSKLRADQTYEIVQKMDAIMERLAITLPNPGTTFSEPISDIEKFNNATSVDDLLQK